jgi:hypothetical protein
MAGAVTLLVLLLVGTVGLLITHWRRPTTAPPRSAARQTPVDSTCAEVLVRDWADGRIDGTYPVVCYRAALKSLPTDLRIYSSAPDDISEALRQRIVQSAQQRPAKIGSRTPAG